MPDFQIKQNPNSKDVCIVGSGAGGGMARLCVGASRVKLFC